MASPILEKEQPTFTHLASGVLKDLQTLANKQIELTRLEVREEWEQTKKTVLYQIWGSLFSLVALVFFGHMMVHYLSTNTNLTVAGAYAWVATVLLCLGLLIMGLARVKFKSEGFETEGRKVYGS